MKRKLLVIVAIILALGLAILSGCKSNDFTPVKIQDDVKITKGLGTFLAEAGDYVYFINGVGTYTEDNTFGKVSKSSLLRIKKEDIGSADKAEVVLPKMMLCSSSETGVYVFGNNVYYATPNTEKSKAGTVLYDQVVFSRYNMSTGKNSVIKTISAYSDYRFVENGGKVYLLYTSEETEDSKTIKHINVYDASKENEKVFVPEVSYSEFLFGDEGSTIIYYTAVAYNEELEADESFYELYSYTVGESEDVKVLDGKSSFDEKASTQGYTFNLIKYQDGVLIGKQTGLDSTYKTVRYFGYCDGKFIDLGYDNTVKTAAFTSSSEVWVGKDFATDKTDINFTYVSSEKLINYNAKKAENEYFFTDCSGYTLVNVASPYVYLYNSNTFYRVDIETNDMYKLNSFGFNNSVKKFLPTIVTVGAKEYIVGVGSETYSYSYLYAIELGTLPLYTEEAEEITEEDILNYNKTILGTMTTTDSESFDKYIEDTYHSDDEE